MENWQAYNGGPIEMQGCLKKNVVKTNSIILCYHFISRGPKVKSAFFQLPI